MSLAHLSSSVEGMTHTDHTSHGSGPAGHSGSGARDHGSTGSAHDASAHGAHGTHAHAAHSHADRPGHGPAPEGDSDMAELLDLDAALGATVLADALDAAAAVLGTEPRSIVDLGAGTGTGTLALTGRFPEAHVHSLDATASMLDHLTASATTAGVGDRVSTHLTDLDGDWPAVLPGQVDLAWAALSLHHVSDPARVLRQVYGALRPGGLLVVTEMSGARFEPSDLGSGRDGLGDRVTAALAAHGYPVTAEWTTALGEACFAPVERHEMTFGASATTAEGARYLAIQLSRNRDRIADDLSADDLAALDGVITALGAGTSEVRTVSGRVVWVAVRPLDTTTHEGADR
jgi:SAM-dependent methyltransferase